MFLKISGNMKPLKGLMKPTHILPKMIPANGFLRDIPGHI
jgi:hypothetical protein